MSDDLTRRMRALIQRMAARYKMGSHDEVVYGICSDARDLMAELPDDLAPDPSDCQLTAKGGSYGA